MLALRKDGKLVDVEEGESIHGRLANGFDIWLISAQGTLIIISHLNNHHAGGGVVRLCEARINVGTGGISD